MRTAKAVSVEALQRLWSELALLRQEIEQARPIDVVDCRRATPGAIPHGSRLEPARRGNGTALKCPIILDVTAGGTYRVSGGRSMRSPR